MDIRSFILLSVGAFLLALSFLLPLSVVLYRMLLISFLGLGGLVVYWDRKKRALFLSSMQQKAILEQKDKEMILESLMEGVLSVDQDLRVQYINFVGSRMLGVPRRSLIGKEFASKKGVGFFEKSRELLLSCQHLHSVVTDSVSIEVGKKMCLDLIAVPKEKGLGAILILQDKSSQYQVLEVGKDFIASASHELKTPITIIRGFAETLQDMKDLPREIVEDIIDKIVRNCQRMEVLIRNLLTLADVENLPWPNRQPCDLVGLIEECIRIVASVHPEAHIHLIKGQETVMAEVDPSLFEQAILNLLSNAAKYSKASAEVHVYLYQKQEEIEISISDKGIGIPAKDLEHIFERFYTVDKAHSRKLGGAGLGLALVKTIVEKHDGTIQVSSALGEGSTFTISLPVSRSC